MDPIQNLSGSSLGQYQLLEQIGLGGMATVYRGFQPSLRREVAIKVLAAALAQQPGYMERFNREAEMAAALEHPNIVPIYDYGVQDGISFVVMRLLTGGTLAERVQRRAYVGGPPPSLGEVADLLKQLASALDYAHKRGVIHRDIKPSNIMFDDQGRAYLMDFGIAKLLESSESLTSSGTSMGTPAYMAPEQWRSEPVTPATDQYSVGVMIYGLVTGEPPFKAPTPYAMMHKHLTEVPAPPQTIRPDLPEGIADVLVRAMAKNPGDRFPTVSALSTAFAAVIERRSRRKTAFFTETMEATSAAPAAGGAGYTPAEAMTAASPPAAANPPVVSQPPQAWPTPTPAPDWSAPQRTPTGGYSPARRRSSHSLFWILSGILALLVLASACILALYLSGVIGVEPDEDGGETVLGTTPTRFARTEEAPDKTGIPPATLTPEPDLATPGTPTAIPSGTGNIVWTPITRRFESDLVDMPMVYAPGGCFRMGSANGQPEEQPVREVCLSPFWISETEVTNAQYRVCVQDGVCAPPSDRWMYDDPQYDHYPVISVSWADAVTYAQWFGGSLPTEAQWEYAARGPQSLVYSWGSTFNGSRANFCDVNCAQDWKDPNANDGYTELAPVGTYPSGASWIGALDLIGNVWEWTADAYSASTYANWENGALDPGGAVYGTDRVLRGGSYTDEAKNSRAAFRYARPADVRTGNLGFRVILIAPLDDETSG